MKFCSQCDSPVAGCCLDKSEGISEFHSSLCCKFSFMTPSVPKNLSSNGTFVKQVIILFHLDSMDPMLNLCHTLFFKRF